LGGMTSCSFSKVSFEMMAAKVMNLISWFIKSMVCIESTQDVEEV
jgi:hypothetical protein